MGEVHAWHPQCTWRHHANGRPPKLWTACGIDRVRMAEKFADVTCKRCLHVLAELPPARAEVYREPQQHRVRPWFGHPGRCEFVIRGGTGLELCGRYPCDSHPRQAGYDAPAGPEASCADGALTSEGRHS